MSTAVWSKSRTLGHPLRDGDRVEVLRELQIDPMTARRVRFEAAG
ncbi:MAG: RnfH family protein, partial [Burkholderiales bacterium]|nr:RnfH family protein [Burkholderiales bacterium]